MVRKKYTKTQTKLNAEQRKKNIKNAFEVIKSHSFKNKIILLIDDVITTGSTVEECACLLKNNQASEVYLASIAMTALN